MRVQLDSKNSPLAMLARTCNSIGKDSALPSTKPSHHPQHQHPQQQQQAGVDKKDSNSARLIKSTSPGKKSTACVETSRKDGPSSLCRQSVSVRGRSSTSPTASRSRACRDGGARRGGCTADGGSPASTTRTHDSDRDSVDEPRRHPPASPYAPPAPPSLGLYDSLRFQHEAAALQAAAVYSATPLHQLLAAQRQFADPLHAMYSAASLQAAAVVAAAAAQVNLGAPARLPGKDYDLMHNGDVDGAVLGGGMFAGRCPPAAHQQASPFTCSWLTPGGEFCAQRFSTSDDLFAHLRTHVDAGADDPLRGAAAALAPPPTVAGLLPSPLGSSFGPSLAAAHAAAAASSFYRSKVHPPRAAHSGGDVARTSPTSTGGSLLLHAAAAAAASHRYHPYKWTAPTPFVAGALASGVPSSDLAPPAPPMLSAFLQQPPYAGLFSAQLGAAVP